MPDEEVHKEGTEPFLEINTPQGGSRTAGMVFILTIISVILIVGFLVFYKYHTDSQATDKEQALQNLQTELNSKKNKKIEDQAAQVNSTVQILSTASKSKYLFKAFIDELVKKITNDTKLNNLSIDSSGKVTMDGQSGSYRSVADLALALKSGSKLKNIQITGLTQSTENGAAVVSFSMIADISDWKSASTTETQAPSATTTPGGEGE